MATTKVKIWNRILGNVGHGGSTKIATDTEDTPGARNIRLYWDESLQEFMEEAWWSFATKYAELTEHATDKVGHWTFTYILPADCVAPRRILASRPQDEIAFEEGLVTAGGGNDKVLFTDMKEAELEYTATVADFNHWPNAAINALALRVAIDVSPEYSGGLKKVQLLEIRYENALERAMVGSHNRQQRREEENESTEFQDQRHGSTPSTRRRESWILT